MILSIVAHQAHLAQSYFSLTINMYNCSRFEKIKILQFAMRGVTVFSSGSTTEDAGYD